MWTDHPDMTIVVDWEIKRPNKQTHAEIECVRIYEGFLTYVARSWVAQSVEHYTGDWRVVSSRLTVCRVTVLCPWARHFICCLVLVQPRKIRLDMTEKLLPGTQRFKTNKLTYAVTETECRNKNMHKLDFFFSFGSQQIHICSLIYSQTSKIWTSTF